MATTCGTQILLSPSTSVESSAAKPSHPPKRDSNITVLKPPTFLRQNLPGVDEHWNPELPLVLNLVRIASGAKSHLCPKHLDVNSSVLPGISDATTKLHEKRRRTAGPGTDFEKIVRASRPGPGDLQSPLLTLQQQVASVFQHGPSRAGDIFLGLAAAAESGVTTVMTPPSDEAVPWNSCKVAATLVSVLACPTDRLYEVFKFQSERLGGVPSYDEIRNTPSASLLTAFEHAKALARGEKGISSVLVVSLLDVHIYELARQGRARGYTSFTHTFVLGIGPEGVIIWQGWDEHGYGLDQWIRNGDARIRSWKEADDFVDAFEKFVAYKVSRLHKTLSSAKANR
jgi:hypothetical protein